MTDPTEPPAPESSPLLALLAVLAACRPDWNRDHMQAELVQCQQAGMTLLATALAALKLAAVADSEPRDLAHDRDHHNRQQARRNP